MPGVWKELDKSWPCIWNPEGRRNELDTEQGPGTVGVRLSPSRPVLLKSFQNLSLLILVSVLYVPIFSSVLSLSAQDLGFIFGIEHIAF